MNKYDALRKIHRAFRSRTKELSAQPTIHWLAKKTGQAYATAQKVWGNDKTEDVEKTDLPGTKNFKQMVTSLWREDPQEQERLFNLYGKAVFGDQVASTSSVQELAPSAVLRLLDLDYESVSSVSIEECSAVEFFGSEPRRQPTSRRNRRKVKLTHAFLDMLRQHRCVMYVEKGGQLTSQSLCEELRASGAIIVSTNVALTSPAIMAEEHRHRHSFQLSVCVSGRVLVTKADARDAKDLLVRELTPGDVTAIPPDVWHAVKGCNAGATQLAINIQSDIEFLADGLRDLLARQPEPDEAERWRPAQRVDDPHWPIGESD